MAVPLGEGGFPHITCGIPHLLLQPAPQPLGRFDSTSAMGFVLFSIFMTFFFICLCIQLSGHARHGSGVESRGQLVHSDSPPTKWVLGIKLRLSDLTADILAVELPCLL